MCGSTGVRSPLYFAGALSPEARKARLARSYKELDGKLALMRSSVLCFSIAAASSSSLIWVPLAGLCGPMSFSFSLSRSISRLRRSLLASSSASLIWNYFLSGRGTPMPATAHYVTYALIGSELRRTA